MSELLDEPVSLSYNNGKIFGSNLVFMGYIILPFALFTAIMQNFILAPIILIVALFLAFTTYGTVIDISEKKIKEYTAYLGFIKIYKSYSYKNFRYLTVIPSKQTTSLNTRLGNAISHTDYLQAVCMLSQNYRNKKELTRFPQRAVAKDIAIKLTTVMNLEYFEYDPKVVRQKLTSK